MQVYIDTILGYSNKLIGVGFDISDDWIGAIILAGLTDIYKPFIMGIEATASKFSSDAIISKLLDSEDGETKGQAFVSKKKDERKRKMPQKKNRKCYNCGSDQHLRNKCDKLPSNANRWGVTGTAKYAFSAFVAQHKKSAWVIDSGASSHMTPYEEFTLNKQNSSVRNISTANSSDMPVKSVGDMKIKVQNKELSMSEVLHVPQLSANLMSVYKIARAGHKVTFDRTGCTVFDSNNREVVHCKDSNGIYILDIDIERCLLSNEKKVSMLTWHRRLAHLNYQSMQKMKNGMNFNEDKRELLNCETCAMGKQSRNSFPDSATKTNEWLELVHSDVCGPMENASIGKSKYMLTFIDDYSKKIFCYFLKSKDQVLNTFIDFKVLVENQTGKRIKTFRRDNGTEYLSSKFDQFCRSNGIQHQLTCPYTPQQNGTAERYNRTIVEKSRCLLHDTNLPKIYWAEAVGMAVFIINRSVCSCMPDKTPEEIWTNKKVDLSNLKLFGAPVMVHVPKEKRKKWDFKSEKLIFIGYDNDTKGFRCTDPKTRRIVVSRDVEFHEPVEESTMTLPDVEQVRDEPLNASINDPSDSSINETSVISINDSSDDFVSTNNSFMDGDQTIDNARVDPDYQPDESIGETSENRMKTRRMVLNHPFQLNYFAYLSEPGTIKEAMDSDDGDKWKLAMDDEMRSHEANGTWLLVEPPENRQPIEAKWVFKEKRNERDEVVRYKARLVAKGCSQKYKIDYEETFSPVVRHSSIRILMAIAVQRNMRVHQTDAITAFLQGDLNEKIFMKQ